ncbi:MAG: LysM peptidoglycan-binding domain-containing protein [Thermodesulfovibrionales bacterium]|nr:LysM peptidoglycan-binding domain-containing protein [Thermodesulfovibrionales bacterium]
MIKKISLIGMLAFMVIAFSFLTSSGQDMEYKEYKVLKGDTLWDISTKEIKDPFLWPKIWKENPDIKNPDRISPSQTIKIPLKLIQKEPEEEAATEKAAAIPEPSKIEPAKEEPPKITEKKIEPVKKSSFADENIIVSSGYITDFVKKEMIKGVGRISGSPSGRTLFGESDYVYIKTDTPANTGAKFYVMRPTTLIRHPKTKLKLGYHIAVPGVLEVVGIENGETKAKITKSFADVLIGDMLEPFYEVEPVIEEESPRRPDVSGVVIASHYMKLISGSYDILFIDKGKKDGLELGDVLMTKSVDKYNNSRTSGIIKIINLKPTTATAIIKRSESAVSVGNEISGLK